MRDLLLVCDLDGTIAFEGQRPADQIIDTLERAVRRERVSVVIATSRSPRSVRDWFGPLVGSIDLLCCNGALTVRRGTEGDRRAIPADLVARVVGELDAAGEDYCLDYGHEFVASAAHALPWMGTRHRAVRDPHTPLATLTPCRM